MRDKADLSDKADQLEHLVLQLQGETDTIGEDHFTAFLSLFQIKRINNHIKKCKKLIISSCETITNVDDLVFLANTPAQAQSLLCSLELAARGIGLYMNSNETEFMCFSPDGAISLSNGKPLKLIDQFIYFGSNISSIESSFNIFRGKAWTPIDRLMTI